MKPWLTWTLGVAFVVGAWFVAFATPPEDAREAPFVVTASVGEQATGRDIVATVEGLRRADTLIDGGWSAEGNWLVVDLSISSRVSPRTLAHATLRVGDRTFAATERADGSLYQQGLTAGVPRRGSIAFELPADLEAEEAVLRLATLGETRLDSVIELPVPMAEIERSAEAELHPREWARP
ncbi:hypothetical protein [uncultured Microbacterium sp.]|uniref:DUF4352 domain-containing protein n=1 Tax=uncultured Microbacterium sp. TaxID=191216 RepID=A0A1Y5P135_9MICO|nr:hypothetical protein [uncultured Microbacterium sp.]SBS72372.1 exported hypothetical protein [uncultured Microbacterium sp.]